MMSLHEYMDSVEVLLLELVDKLGEIWTQRDGYVTREVVEEYIQGYPRMEKTGIPVEKVAEEALELIFEFGRQLKNDR